MAIIALIAVVVVAAAIFGGVTWCVVDEENREGREGE